jgi:hypothetical protein
MTLKNIVDILPVLQVGENIKPEQFTFINQDG